VRFLIDECPHTSLVGVAQERGHEASHVNWLGLSGETDWGLMPRVIQGDFTFVTNNAADFRRLYANEPIVRIPSRPICRLCQMVSGVCVTLYILLSQHPDCR
jgi:hypothetical protein